MTTKTGIFLPTLAWLWLAGCAAVGPDYRAPESKVPEHWHATLGNGVTPAAHPEALAEWWRAFDDPLLTELVKQAVAGNLDLRRAQSRLRQARAERGGKQADLAPTVDATSSFSRARTSDSGALNNLYQLGLDAGWEVDLFGGRRRAVEAADAGVASGEADLDDVLVSLLGDVALDYLDLRTYQARIEVVEKNLASLSETFAIVRWRAEAGQIGHLDVEQARANLEQTRSQLPDLKTSLIQAENALAVLLGVPPGSLNNLLAETRPIPNPPAEVAVGVPAETLRQRPDIRKAERELAAQTATVGVATAELYPKFNLSGSIGLDALSSGKFFTASNRTWRIAPGISWNLFDADRIRQNIAIQSELQEQALLTYQATVLGALREVENALTAYADEQKRHALLDLATQAAERAAELASMQYQAGLIDYLTVLETERSQLSLQQQLAESQGQVMINLVRLYKVLGGGWNALPANAASHQEDTL
ncbi:efflux transporter outer membrane subunit [Trichloromonas sp.]|uniref:efflux transporter outer membrane subunit n=1 Tax=Trichloromonas sp. TaxID=3069249 RepID=UPI002A3CA8A3|nr:efflux transporter outer membrane subunit [Trichloromonas sp.]